MNINFLRDNHILAATARMEQLIRENPGGDALWKAQVRSAQTDVEVAIMTLAAAGDIAGLQAFDVAAHPSWPVAPAGSPPPPPPPAPPATTAVEIGGVTYTIAASDAAALSGAFLLVLQGQEVPVMLASGQQLTVTGANATALAAALTQLQGG